MYLRIRKGLGRRLTKIGERCDIHSLIYNPLTMRDLHEHGVNQSAKVVSCMMECLPVFGNALDVGSGGGAFAAELEKYGKKVVAIEHSKSGRKIAARQGVDCRPFDLNQNPPAELTEPFDLVYCFEVAEHLPPELGDQLVKYISSFNTLTIFSAAHPGQGGVGHINEQQKPYWINRFERERMLLDKGLTQTMTETLKRYNAAFWFVSNVLVFRPSAEYV